MDARIQGTFHDGHQDGLKPLRPLDLGACSSVDDLVRGMAQTSFGGRKTGEAADVLEAMVRDPDCGVVMSLSGAMTIAKMGLLITDMIDRGMVQCIVSTGALIAHGLVEGAGNTHFKHDPRRSDEDNYRDGYNRVYDTLELEANLDDVEGVFRSALEDVDPATETLCSSFLHEKIGQWLVEHRPQTRGILQSAWKQQVPILVPAFTDSELGMDVATYNRERIRDGKQRFAFDPYLDLEYYLSIGTSFERLGLFTIGGGVPRNWAQEIGPFVELLAARELISDPQKLRFRYAARICPEPVHWGGLSGATYTEGVSWGKFVPPSEGGRHVEVPADATIAWPLIAKAVFERLDREPASPVRRVHEAVRGVLWTGPSPA